MRVAGPLLLDVLLLIAGEAVLVALGLVRTRRQGVVLAGLAFVLGWAVLGCVETGVLMLGGGIAWWHAVVLVALLGGVAALLRHRVAPAPAPAATRPGRSLVGLVAAAGLVAYLALLGVHAARAGTPAAWDGWSMWIPRAKALYFFHGIHPGLRGGFVNFAHPEYPPLVPAMDAVVFVFARTPDQLVLPLQDWLFAVAFLGALAGLLCRRVPGRLLWPSLLALALAPAFGDAVGSGLADQPLARLVALAAVCGGLWLLEREWRLLAVAGILLTAAAQTKTEGLMFGLLLGACLVAAAFVERPRQLRGPVLLALVPLVAVVPWKLWLRVEHVLYTPDYKLGDVVAPSAGPNGTNGDFTAETGSRLIGALEHVPHHALALDRWLLLIPVAVLLAVLVLRRRPGLGILVLGVVLFGYLGLVAVYWTSSLDLTSYLNASAERVSTSIVFVCAGLAPLLAAELLRREDAP